MSTMTRTDIHRPSAPEFDPEGYDFFGCFDLGEPMDNAARVSTVSRLVSEGYRFTSVHGSGQCGHCGARIRYAALMGHRDTKGLIWVGETCLDNRFDLTKAEFDTLRKAAALNRERTAKRDRIAALLAEHPVLAWASYAHNIASAGAEVYFTAGWDGPEFATEAEAQAEIDNCPNTWTRENERPVLQYRRGTTWSEKTRTGWETSTLQDIWYKIERYADPSDKQIAFVGNLVQKLQDAEVTRVEREAATAAKVAEGVKVPTGRVEVEGTVVSTKYVDNAYGGSLKMLVQHESGWKVWGTVPSSLDVEKGDTVRFTATVEASNDDPLFGFYKRPTKASKA